MSAERFTLQIEDHVDEFGVASFAGREKLNTIPRFELAFTSDAPLEASSVLGKGARLSVSVGAEERVFTGIVDRFERGTPLANGRARHHIRIVPRLAKLERRKWSAIFQDLTTLEIVTAVFKEHGVTAELRCVVPLPKREICIQHEETDLEFVRRLLAEEGLAFRVEHPSATAPPSQSEVVVIFDTAAGYGSLEGGAVLAFRRGDAGVGMVREERDVTQFVSKKRDGNKSVLLDDYDFKFPARFATSSAPLPAPLAEIPRKKPSLPLDGVLEHHGPYGEMQSIVRPATAALEQIVRHDDLYRGRSSCARLSAGRTFSLEGHDDGSLNGAYAVVEVRHRGEAQSEGASYENEFVAARSTFLFRPKRPVRKVRQSIESATVVGPKGEEIYADEYGRIKVEFHWDLRGSTDERSSCWIRVAQGWAGSGWGFQFIPRIGMEVLVAFLGGDPDQPVIVGCLPNANNRGPYPLPKDKTKSGIRTQSTPKSAGYNEICFEDSAGGEEFRIHAQRDMSTKVLRNEVLTVGGDRNIDVSGALTHTVAGEQRTTIVGASTTTLESGGQLTVHGLYAEVIEGHLASSASGNRDVHIKGSDQRTIEAHAEERVVGPWTMKAETTYTLVVGTDEGLGRADIQIRGDHSFTADKRSVLEAHEGITLRSGDSSIEITPEGVTINAPTVHLKGTHAVIAEGAGPAMRLEDKAEIVSDEIHILAKKSSLKLDEEAQLKGTKIGLAAGEDKPAEKSDEPPPPNTKKLSVALSDENFEPYKSKHYELVAEAARFTGTTNGEGGIEHDVPETAKLAQITLWIDEYPKGRKREYSITLRETPPIDTPAGVKVRLANLGYYHGATDTEALDDAVQEALRSFQADHKLAQNGRPDDKTKAAIVHRHGH